MRRALAIAILIIACGVGLKVQAGDSKAAIINSKHDFRATSTATIRSISEGDVCVFCHTPHNANPGMLLWNHTLSTQNFPTYQSSTLQSVITPITPADASKLCLSCHDGTIALGETVDDGTIDFVQGSSYTLPPSSPSNLAGAIGFTDDHPFGFVPQVGAQIQPPPSGDAVHLDRNGKVQCTSCHQAHQENVDAVVGKFLVKPNPASSLCQSCHQKAGWMGSAHRIPPDPVEDQKYTVLQGAHTGYTGVSNNGCESCHKPHTAQVGPRLIKFPEENVCFQCHDGSVTGISRNIKNEFLAKTYKHPVILTPSVHDASESPNSTQFTLPEASASMPRHGECFDCHNSHASQATPGAYTPQPPLVTPPLLGVKGQSAGNGYLPQSTNEYEICFKCHADSANKPQSTDTGTAGIGFGRNPQRQSNGGNPNAYNTRIEFTTGASYHPVTRPRNSSSVPSLRPYLVDASGAYVTTRPLMSGSLIFCSDCHNNDTGRNLVTGGSGPTGPHGSNIPHLLERQSTLEPVPGKPGGASPGVTYSLTSYALCDKCHDVQGSILRDITFKHSEHVQSEGSACSTCHDPHAAPWPALVNFDLSIVGPNSTGQLSYINSGPGHGTCNLMCHAHDHVNESY